MKWNQLIRKFYQIRLDFCDSYFYYIQVFYHLQHPVQNARIPPPGLHPMNIPPPGMRHLPPPINHHHPPPGVLPPGYMRMMPPHPQFLQANGHIRPPGFLYPPPGNQNQFPVSYFYYSMPIVFLIFSIYVLIHCR